VESARLAVCAGWPWRRTGRTSGLLSLRRCPDVARTPQFASGASAQPAGRLAGRRSRWGPGSPYQVRQLPLSGVITAERGTTACVYTPLEFRRSAVRSCEEVI
jgi:hypothetical protein